MSSRAASPSTSNRAVPLATGTTRAALGAIVLVAILFGYVASRADAVVIAATVSGVVGLALLARPVWIIWAILAVGLLVVGLVPLWADSASGKAVWGVSILGFVLLMAALLHMAADSRTVANTPGFVWLTLVFMVYALVNSLLQFTTPMDFIGGFKRYFSMYGLIFCLAWIYIDSMEINRWRKFTILIAIAQLPWAIFQVIKLVPIREAYAYAYPGMVPLDVVAGTFGSTLTRGGASAEMAAFLVIILSFLLSRLREGAIARKIFYLSAPLVITPLFLGETKIVLVIVPLVVIIIYRRDLLTRPAVGLVALLLGSIFTGLVGLVYVHMSGSDIGRVFEDTIRYNFGNIGYGGVSLNRATALSFWLQKQSLSNPLAAVFGNGLGAALDSRDISGHLARQYPGMGIGLTVASTLLWEQGVAGFLIFMSLFAYGWRTANLVMRCGNKPWIRADAAAIQAGLSVLFLWVFYRNSLLDLVTIQIVFGMLFGYLAWLYRYSRSSIAIEM